MLQWSDENNDAEISCISRLEWQVLSCSSRKDSAWIPLTDVMCTFKVPTLQGWQMYKPEENSYKKLYHLCQSEVNIILKMVYSQGFTKAFLYKVLWILKNLRHSLSPGPTPVYIHVLFHCLDAMANI
jgi:hypothetical protein